VILVTGATGFIGSHLVARLASQGHQVLGVGRYEPRAETRFLLRDIDGVEFLLMGRDDSEFVTQVITHYQPSAIIHLDANVNVPGLNEEPEKAVQDNFLSTFSWMDTSVRHGVSRFILASSIGVLPRVQYEPIDESHPIILANEGPGSRFYGASKAACELFGLSFKASSGLQFCAIRCSAVFGFGMQWPIGIKPAVEAIARGEKVSIPGFGPPRDYTPVDYVVDIFEAAATMRDTPPGVLYGATGRPLVSVPDLNQTLLETFPDAEIDVTDDNTDPEGVESLYRGVIDMQPTRRALNLGPPADSLRESLVRDVAQHRAFLEWQESSAL
jgi:nucleoside-diphosphate-sugar epimerase